MPAPVVVGPGRRRVRLPRALLAVIVAVVVVVGVFLVFGDSILSSLDSVQDKTARVVPPMPQATRPSPPAGIVPPALVPPPIVPPPAIASASAPASTPPVAAPGVPVGANPAVVPAPVVPTVGGVATPLPAATPAAPPGATAAVPPAPSLPPPSPGAPVTAAPPAAPAQTAAPVNPVPAAPAPTAVTANTTPGTPAAKTVTAEQNLPAILDRIRQQSAAQTLGSKVMVAHGPNTQTAASPNELRDADGQPVVTVDSAALSNRERTDTAYDMLMHGQYEGALELYNSILRTSPNSFSALIGRATALHKLRRYGEARSAYRTVLNIDPQNPQALTNLLSIIAQGEPDQALNDLRDMAKQYPGFSPIAAAVGDIQIRRGNTQDALLAYGHAVALSPESGTYRLNLAIIQDRAGMVQDAAASYARALQLLEGNESLPIPVDQVRARLRYLQSR